jgi:hypothetical protein
MIMNGKIEFSTKISDEWKDALKKRNALDAIDFLKSAQEKLLFSTLDINSYYHIRDSNKKAYDEWNKKLFEQGSISNFPQTTIDYFSTQVPADFLLSKVSYNLFNSLHSFFDNYAHFLHRSLYPNETIPEKLYFFHVSKKISKDPIFQVVSVEINNYTGKTAFKYINNIDNTNKHRRLISPQTTMYLNDGEQKIVIPAFEKNGKNDEKEMEDILEDCYELCIDFYNEVTSKVFDCIK